MDESKLEALTFAERATLRAALGRTNGQVAALLGISTNTVAAHMLAARRKLGSPPRGDAARALHDWEASHHKVPSQFEAMDRPFIRPETGATGVEPLREPRVAFVFTDQVDPVTPQGAVAIQREQGERIMMILLAVALMLASIRFLPDLVERARQAVGVINPVLDHAGVKRSG